MELRCIFLINCFQFSFCLFIYGLMWYATAGNWHQHVWWILNTAIAAINGGKIEKHNQKADDRNKSDRIFLTLFFTKSLDIINNIFCASVIDSIRPQARHCHRGNLFVALWHRIKADVHWAISLWPLNMYIIRLERYNFYDSRWSVDYFYLRLVSLHSSVFSSTFTFHIFPKRFEIVCESCLQEIDFLRLLFKKMFSILARIWHWIPYKFEK